MNHYYVVTFTGRMKGALGSFSPMQATVLAASKEAAILKVYETHEHLTNVKAIMRLDDLHEAIRALEDFDDFDNPEAVKALINTVIDCIASELAS